MKTKTETTAGHTPTPWRLGHSETSEIAIRIGKGTRADDCVAVVCDLLEGEAEANAAFIILAVNHHEKLVKACFKILALHDDAVFISGDDDAEKVDDALSEIRTLLSKLQSK